MLGAVIGSSVAHRLGRTRRAHDPDSAAAVVAEEVAAAEQREVDAAVDVAAGHRAVVGAIDRVAVLDHRERPAARQAARHRLVAVAALHVVPAVVHAPAAATRRRRPVDLLPRILADVADPQVAGDPVERPAPRIAQPERPDLVGAGLADERIRRGDAVALAGSRSVDVDPEHLAEQARAVLGVVLGVAAGAAVAHPDVEVAVGPECHAAAVVIGIGLGDHEDLAARPERDDVRVRCHPVLVDDRRAVGLPGVVDVELAVRRERRVEREAEQAPLAAADDERVDIEERRRGRSGLERPDRAGLLDDEPAPRPVPRVRDEDRVAEA